MVVPFERRTIEETWERGNTPYPIREIDYIDVDHHGNVIRQQNRIIRTGQSTPRPGRDNCNDFCTRWLQSRRCCPPARMTQTDGNGNVLATTITYYDRPAFQGLPEGQIITGAVTRIVEDLVLLTDALAQTVYGTPSSLIGNHHLIIASPVRSAGGSHVAATSEDLSESTTLLARGPRGADSTSVTDSSSRQFIRRLIELLEI